MLWQWSPSVVVEVMTSASLMVLAIYFPWRDLNRRVSILGATLLLISALWMLSHALEIGLAVATYKSYLMGAQLVWGIIAVTLWLFYIAHYIGPRRLLTRRIYILFGVVPLVALLAVVTNHVYGLMWTDPGLDSNNPYLPLSPTYGIVYWACVAYYTVLVVAGSFLIIWNVIRLRLIRRLESTWLLVAAFIPLLVSLAEVMGVSSSLKLTVGVTPWAACIGAVIILWNLPRFHLEKVIPVARDTVFERISDCIVVLDMQNHVIDLNPAAEKLLGYSVSSALGLPVKQIWPDCPNQVITSDENLETSRELVLEQSGKQKTYDLRVSTITDLDGRPASKVLLLADITERKQMEEALKKSQERYRTLVESASEAICVIQDGVVKFANPRTTELSGYSLEKRMPFIELVHPDDRDMVISRYLKRLAGEEIPSVYTFRIIDKEGDTKWVELNSGMVTWEGNPAVLALLTDITKRKQAEEALRETEAQYRLLADHMEDQVWLMDLNLKPTYISPSVEKLRGYTFEEIAQLPLDKQLTATSFQSAMEYFSIEMPKALADPTYFARPLELEFYRKDGSTLWVENMFSLIWDENGKPLSLLGVGRDIIERKRAEEALQKSEALYHLLADNMKDTIWLMNMELITTYISPSVVKLRGFTMQEIQEMSLEQHLTPASLELAMQVFSAEMAMLAANPRYTFQKVLELEFYRKDGSTFWSENTFSLIRDKSGKPISILGEGRDITERKQAEEELQQSYQKLQKAMEGTIQAIASTSEARDPYTAGHQRRVANLASAIAEEMGFPQEKIEEIRVAATLHDIGKINVPSEILSKPGRLTALEFNLIKAHPEISRDILKTLELPWTICPSVLQHHERMDGSGYPSGLSGEAIVLEARILAVADVVEAMASHRPYRPALGIDKALEEISKNRGILYDPDVVDACLRLFNEKEFKFEE